jgi:hypothetical protein
MACAWHSRPFKLAERWGEVKAAIRVGGRVVMLTAEGFSTTQKLVEQR